MPSRRCRGRRGTHHSAPTPAGSRLVTRSPLAARAALACRDALRALGERWRGEGLAAPGFLIGLQTGALIVGEIGAAERRAYRAVGDAMNVAARIEGANKAYGTELLVSEATRAAAGPALAAREVDRVRVVGRGEPLALYELAGPEATLPPTPCNDAIGAIPRDLLQELAVLSMAGRIGGRIQARIDSRDLEATQLVIRVADGCRFELVPPIADLSRFEAPFVHRVEEPDGTIFGRAIPVDRGFSAELVRGRDGHRPGSIRLDDE